ncbi:MAG: LrgB family protein [Oscillospiraceae bacterium]
MSEYFSSSLYFGLLLSLLAYHLAARLKQRFKLAIFNPVMVSIILVMAFLLIFNIDFEHYNSSAQYLSYLLTPTTVCLAVPLYQQMEKLKKYSYAILGGILAGVVTNLCLILALSTLFHLSHETYVTLLPKSITSAIAIPLCEEYGGIVAIMIAAITLTGLLGNVIAESVCRWFKITEPVAKGIAIGTSSHGTGTAKAIELGEVEGAMSSLAIAVAGIMTVIIAPFFVGLY